VTDVSSDQPGAVREPLNIEALAPMLREVLGADGPIAVEQFRGGYSNLTYLLRAGNREVVLRRPPPGAPPGGHDMEREHTVLRRLYGHVPVPEALLFVGADASPIGVPFYVMERVRGVVLRGTLGDQAPPKPTDIRAVSDALVDALAGLHALDPAGVGLAGFGRPEGYVRRQVEGWAKRYARARTDDVPEVERAFDWLAEHAPSESGVAVLHNDYKHDNLVLDPDDWTRIRAVLDWEMATVGDPLLDLGSTLGYWVEPDDPPALRALALSPTVLPGNPTREGVVARYAAASGRAVSDPVFYYVYGLMKLAGIAQQIYARYVAGHTTDARFAGLLHAVRACGEVAERAVARGRISGLG